LDVGGDRPAFVAAIFGSIYEEWARGDWLETLAKRCDSLGRRLVLVQIGRAGAAGEAVWRRLEKRGEGRAEFRSLGELPAREVSIALQGADFGIATSPWPMIDKSSVTATMLEHGLPVVVIRTDSLLRRGSTPAPRGHPLLHRLDDFLQSIATTGLRRAAPAQRDDAYRLFLSALEHRGSRVPVLRAAGQAVAS